MECIDLFPTMFLKILILTGEKKFYNNKIYNVTVYTAKRSIV